MFAKRQDAEKAQKKYNGETLDDREMIITIEGRAGNGKGDASGPETVARVLAVHTSIGGCQCGLAQKAFCLALLRDGRLCAIHLADETCSCGSDGLMFTVQFADTVGALVAFGLDSAQRAAFGLNCAPGPPCPGLAPRQAESPFASFAVVRSPPANVGCDEGERGDCHVSRYSAGVPACRALSGVNTGLHVHYQKNHHVSSQSKPWGWAMGEGGIGPGSRFAHCGDGGEGKMNGT